MGDEGTSSNNIHRLILSPSRKTGLVNGKSRLGLTFSCTCYYNRGSNLTISRCCFEESSKETYKVFVVRA